MRGNTVEPKVMRAVATSRAIQSSRLERKMIADAPANARKTNSSSPKRKYWYWSAESPMWERVTASASGIAAITGPVDAIE